MNEYDRRHMLRLAAIAKMVERLYDAAADDAAAIAAEAVRLGADGEKPFDFADYPGAQSKMEELLAWLRSQLEVVVAEGVAGEWLLSDEKNDALVRSVLGISEEEEEGGESGGTSRPRTGKLPEKVRRRWMERNEKARDAFLKREERGMGLSKYVWKVTERLPTEMRMSIDMGILDGKPAAAMARDIKQYLKFPDKLFRRVRDERGILHLSKNAAAFHPGQGVYRSSYQNARRLAVTETNMAYRTADHERWQRLDFVVGIEIHLSGNHTCKGRDGKPHRFTDICDQLQGKYPKDFKFTGWHPHCRCYATTILKTEEEMDADMDRIMAGEPVDGESVNKVDEPPKGFKDWVEKNEERIAQASKKGTLAGWVKENSGYVEVKASNTPIKALPAKSEQKRSTDIHDLRDTSPPPQRIVIHDSKDTISSREASKDEAPPHLETYKKVADHVYVSDLNQEAEREGNIRMAIFLAEKTNDDVFVLPHIQPNSQGADELRKEYFPSGVKENKNPDLFFRKRFVDEKCMHPEDISDAKKTKRNIQYKLRDAFEQADDAYVEIPTSIPIEWVESAIKGKLKSSNNFHYVYIRYGDELLTFYDKNKPVSQ